MSNATGASFGPRTQLRVNILDGTAVNQAPNSVAGASQTVAPGDNVVLNGSQSNDPDGDRLTYVWSQTMGPAVTLTNADTETASFTAPSITSDTLLRFELAVSDTGGLSDTATVSITVSAGSPAAGGDTGGGGGGGPVTLWLLGLLGVMASRRALTRTGAS